MRTLNLEQYQKEFTENLESQGKSFNTVKNYRTDLNIFKGFLISKGRSLEINEVTISEIAEYGDYLNKKYDSPNSIRRRVQALRLFFDFLIRQDLFQENPVKKMLVSPKVVDLPKPTPFHIIRQLREKLTTIANTNKGHEKLLAMRNVLLFDLIYGGGLKVSDVERLHSKHVYSAKSKFRVIVAPDNRDPYTIPLDGSIVESIENYNNELEKGKNRDKIDFDNLLFNGNPFKILSGSLSARGIEIIFKDFSKLVNTQVTAKYLRQACIFKWLSQNTPHSRIKEWMGVQPQYSLKPYIDLLENSPTDFAYLEI